ncbi:MAG: hypothetical protein QOF74_8480 [Caballeronia mineralivorans]|jgi:hypothetical protein|nr:hypothetical protein [Caballeronia mineralivorans]
MRSAVTPRTVEPYEREDLIQWPATFFAPSSAEARRKNFDRDAP